MDASAQRPKVAQIFPPQHAEAATVLGRAFIDDPLISAIVGNISDPIDRAARMGRLFSMILGDHRKLGQPVVGVMHEGRVGAAAIIEQVSHVPSVITTILQGFATEITVIDVVAVGIERHRQFVGDLFGPTVVNVSPSTSLPASTGVDLSPRWSP